MDVPTINYTAHPTLAQFHACDDFVRCVKGPFGSGKSVAAIMEVLLRSMNQAYTTDGKRRSKWAIVRNSYRELSDSTLSTFREWVPMSLGIWREGDYTFHMKFNDVESTILLRALDRPDDIRKLLSVEYTGIFFNEMRHIQKPIFDVAQGRVGRFPRRQDYRDEIGWTGIWGDTNPPDEDHWIYETFEEKRPEGFKIFHQPGGRDVDAENLDNLPDKYYERLALGKDQAWVSVYVDGKYGFVMEGKPVHPLFKHHRHVSEVDAVPHIPIGFGCDFGLTPAAVFGQQLPTGQVIIFDEIVTEDMGAEKFGGLVSEKLRGEYQRHRSRGWGDPAGDERSAIREEETVFKILRGQGIPIIKAPSNDPVIRQEALNHLLSRLDMKGEPAIRIHPRCRMLIRGLSGGYKYRRMQVSGAERFTDKPDKNIYSHVCEALHYYLLGAGLGYQVIDGRQQRRPPKVRRALGRVA